MLKHLNDGFVSYKYATGLEILSPHERLTDGLEWCGLLWYFYQLFGLSFWWHPFTADDPLVSKWRDAIQFFKYFWWRNKLFYILNGLRVSTLLATFLLWLWSADFLILRWTWHILSVHMPALFHRKCKRRLLFWKCSFSLSFPICCEIVNTCCFIS